MLTKSAAVDLVARSDQQAERTDRGPRSSRRSRIRRDLPPQGSIHARDRKDPMGGTDARDPRAHEALRRRGGSGRCNSQRSAGSDRGVPRSERSGEDHDDAGDLRADASRPGRDPLEGEAGRPPGAGSIRLHARGAGSVSEDEDRRGAHLLRRAVRDGRDGREGGGRRMARAPGPSGQGGCAAGRALPREPAAGATGRGAGTRP